MAFNPSPTGAFPNINVTGIISGQTGVFIPYGDLESFDYSVAVAGSGDIRQLIYSIVEGFTDYYVATDSADRPSKLTVSRSASVPTDDTIRKIYTITATLELADTSVVSE